MHPHTKNPAPTGTGPAPIPDYAHPIPVGADGLRFRKVHGPRTQESTERRSQYRAAVAQELTARARSNPFTRADYMAVTP